MIEIKDIVKTYHPKKGGVVAALDNISLKFPEKGLVFILGKSGSGKSTLLNVMGGLDNADSGEIIIKGKSSKDFTMGDFDSYRNTYLGFIFQEYNILEDFNVGSNIALALKLQGEKATNEKINAILDEVGLSGYGKRKPNELSGGQKQRVAIARALVKNPEIIMADEPTGALDSNTGIQVFDTLKDLSKNKLVIVVSHDREFAEEYGDRVIELKDGKVISDIEKHHIDATVEEGGAKNYNGKLFHFPKGYRLTKQDVERINAYLEKEEAYLSLDEKVNSDVKAASHIDKEGKMESFAPTDENAIHPSAEKPFKLIKSRMPFKESFKMGVSGMKTKPVRLITTILLSFTCFSMFGIVDSFAAYDSNKAIVNSMQDSGIHYATFKKMVEIDNYGEDYFVEKRFSDADIEQLKKKTGHDFLPVLTQKNSDSYYGSSTSIANSFLKESSSNVYDGSLTGIVEMDEESLTKHGLSLSSGRLPTASDEIAISDYDFACFQKWGYAHVDLEGKPDENKNLASADIQNEDFFLQKEPNLQLDGGNLKGIFKIVGVVDTDYDYSRYLVLDQEMNREDALGYYMLQDQFKTEHRSAFSGMIFGGQGFFADFLAYKGIGGEILDNASLSVVEANGETNGFFLGNNYNHYFTQEDGLEITYLNKGKTSLEGNEIVLSFDVLRNALSSLYRNDIDVQNSLDHLLDDPMDPDKIASVFKPLVENVTLKMSCGGSFSPYFTQNVSIQGFFFESNKVDSSFIGVSQTMATAIQEVPVGKYAMAISGEKLSKHELEKLVDFSGTSDNGVKFTLVNYVVSMENMVGSIIKTVAQILLYVGIAVFLFAVILFMTYISASVSYKKREIGILRAVGARSSDVFGIFFNEALVISLIVFGLATIASAVTVGLANASLRSTYGLPITLLSYGIREIGLILLGCVATALVASFLPVLRIASKKPIDAIKNR